MKNPDFQCQVPTQAREHNAFSTLKVWKDMLSSFYIQYLGILVRCNDFTPPPPFTPPPTWKEILKITRTASSCPHRNILAPLNLNVKYMSMRKLQCFNAMDNLLTKFQIEKINLFNFLNFLTWYEVETSTGGTFDIINLKPISG